MKRALALCCAAVSVAALPQFCDDPKAHLEGTVHTPSDATYEEAKDQYAYSSAPDKVAPSVIVYAETDQHIQTALKFAKQCKASVSVRSGGHQYSALSSCHEARCIQIDVSLRDMIEIEGTHVTLGAGVKLNDVYAVLGGEGLFLPGGECGYVNVGGHVQTGGYGLLGRSFGLFGDHVVAFDIILANGKKRHVLKPGTGQQPGAMDTLFWAVLGGGAGSWGVITQYEFEARRDEDYPHSTLVVCAAPYSSDLASSAMQLMKSVSDNEEWQEQTDESIWLTFLGEPPITVTNLPTNTVSFRVVWKGDTPFDSSTMDVFSELLWCKALAMPLSRVLTLAKMPTAREMPMPYIRRVSPWKGSFDEGFDAQRMVEIFDEVAAQPSSGLLSGLMGGEPSSPGGLMGGIIIATIGGAITSADPDSDVTSYPLRDAAYCVNYALFYSNELDPEAEEKANANMAQWHESVHNEDDFRFVWGTFGNVKIEDVWEKYYDNHADFHKLRTAKTRFDPRDTFRSSFTIPPLSRDWKK